MAAAAVEKNDLIELDDRRDAIGMIRRRAKSIKVVNDYYLACDS